MKFIVAGMTGAIILSCATVAYHRLFFPVALNDGQYGIVWLFTAPAGALMGAATLFNFAASQHRQSYASLASLCCSVLVAVPVGAFALLTAVNSRSLGGSFASALLGSLLFALPTLLCVMILFLWGLYLRLYAHAKI